MTRNATRIAEPARLIRTTDTRNVSPEARKCDELNSIQPAGTTKYTKYTERETGEWRVVPDKDVLETIAVF
jgi:hypothetical protein